MKKITVFSHKQVWKSNKSPISWATDGGFVFHMNAINSIFDEMEIITPEINSKTKGEIVFKDKSIKITPIQISSKILGWKRKIMIITWALLNLQYLINKVKNSDIIHTPIPSDIGTIGMLIAFLFKKPLFIRHCGNWYEPRTLAEKFWKFFMIKYTKNNIVSFATGGGCKYPTIENKNINWIFSTSLLESELFQLNGINNQKRKQTYFKLIIVSRQIKAKGTDKVLKAVALLKNDNIKLEIVGDGEDLDYFKTLKNKLSLKNNVTFSGKMNNKEVLKKIISSDLFCFPTSSSEGFPKVVLEAMACGTPVITTNVSVLPELIGKTNSGIILNNNSYQELAYNIKYLMENPKDIDIMSINCLKTVKNYSLENWVDVIAKKLSNSFNKELIRKKTIIK